MTDSKNSSFTSNASTNIDPGPSGSSRSTSFLQSSGPSLQSTAPLFSSPSSTIRSNPSQPMMTSLPLRMPSRVLPNNQPLVQKRFIIRADPTMVSNFDPADKELYDLWAPKP